MIKSKKIGVLNNLSVPDKYITDLAKLKIV